MTRTPPPRFCSPPRGPAHFLFHSTRLLPAAFGELITPVLPTGPCTSLADANHFPPVTQGSSPSVPLGPTAHSLPRASRACSSLRGLRLTAIVRPSASPGIQPTTPAPGNALPLPSPPTVTRFLFPHHDASPPEPYLLFRMFARSPSDVANTSHH